MNSIYNCRIKRFSPLKKRNRKCVAYLVLIGVLCIINYFLLETLAPSSVPMTLTGMPSGMNNSPKEIGKPITYKTTKNFRRIGSQKTTGRVCIFTQTSLDRFLLLEQLILSWQHSISVAVYISSDADVQRLSNEMNRLEIGLRNRLKNTAQIKVSILYGRKLSNMYDEYSNPYDDLYPINALRNLAYSQCQTEYVLPLDVDFVLSNNANLMMGDYLDSLTRSGSNKYALVIPSFEWINVMVRMPFNIWEIQDLQHHCSDGNVIPFHAEPYDSGSFTGTDVEEWCRGFIETPKHFKMTKVQGLTNYTKWFKSQNPYLLDTTKIDPYYEPYLVVKKSLLPPFDERFRGYGFNKRVHSMTMQSLGFSFLVLPNVFTVHRYHVPSQSKLELYNNQDVSKILENTFEVFKYELYHRKINNYY